MVLALVQGSAISPLLSLEHDLAVGSKGKGMDAYSRFDSHQWFAMSCGGNRERRRTQTPTNVGELWYCPKPCAIESKAGAVCSSDPCDHRRSRKSKRLLRYYSTVQYVQHATILLFLVAATILLFLVFRPICFLPVQYLVTADPRLGRPVG